MRDSAVGVDSKCAGMNGCRKEFLGDTEKVLRAALVHKKRRVFNVKRRQLLLTDAPRIIYIDPATRKEMGRITFDIVVKAVVKDPAHFIIQTVRHAHPAVHPLS